MISMVLPYWQRKSALASTLDRFKTLYADLHALEIIIVDDGSPEAAEINGEFPWPVSVIRLPHKTVALNPCVPFNAGAAKAYGEKIVISNPEVVHRTPILQRMSEVLDEIGETGYVAAACQSFNGTWYCHSTLMPSDRVMGRAPSPPGAGLHFCSMMFSSFYADIGGFSEEYRNGQAYEDNDFLWKLHSVGATFRILDDCITDHVDCERCLWPKGGLARNKKIFESRWQI